MMVRMAWHQLILTPALSAGEDRFRLRRRTRATGKLENRNTLYRMSVQGVR